MSDCLTATTELSPSAKKTAAAGNWLLGQTPVVRRITKHIERAAEVECTVLLSGETGTGKEVFARMLHAMGPRVDRSFIPVNCAALTATLAESQLFGHEKGAFTGADGRSLGVFRAAQGGIVFLDEVGDMPLDLQPKLLRVLQEREVTPVGSTQPVEIDVQVVAATNRNLEADVAAGLFREDLYYRLNMVELKVPPLRERRADIPEFIKFFSARCAARYGRPQWSPDPLALARFSDYDWPGNVRQLAHVIEQSYVLDHSPTLPDQDRQAAQSFTLPFTDLRRLRNAAVRQALATTGGHKARAAKLLGVHANTLTRLLAQLDGNGSADDTFSP